MAKAQSNAQVPSTRGSFNERLESPRLRQVHDHYADVEAPLHVVASAAIFQVNKILSARMEAALAEIDLTPPRYEILGILDNSTDGRLSLRQLLEATLYHPATMTYTIDTLEKRGLIKRQSHPSDRRAVIIQITPPGRRLARSGTLRLDGITWGLEDLSDADAEALAILLSKVQPA